MDILKKFRYNFHYWLRNCYQGVDEHPSIKKDTNYPYTQEDLNSSIQPQPVQNEVVHVNEKEKER